MFGFNSYVFSYDYKVTFFIKCNCDLSHLIFLDCLGTDL